MHTIAPSTCYAYCTRLVFLEHCSSFCLSCTLQFIRQSCKQLIHIPAMFTAALTPVIHIASQTYLVHGGSRQTHRCYCTYTCHAYCSHSYLSCRLQLPLLLLGTWSPQIDRAGAVTDADNHCGEVGLLPSIGDRPTLHRGPNITHRGANRDPSHPSILQKHFVKIKYK